MDYFLVKADDHIGNRVKLTGVEEKPTAQVCVQNFSDKICYVDYLEGKTLIVSEKLKRILELYEPDLEWYLTAITDPKLGEQKNYYQTDQVPAVDCLDGKTRFTDSGRVRHLVLNKARINRRSFFDVRTVKEQFLIIRLDVAESLLRRNLYGLELKRVDCVWEEQGVMSIGR